MSVLLNIPMPKTCEDCPLEIVEDDGLHTRSCSVMRSCYVAEKDTEYDRYFRRLKNCPIVCELPKGHGRLIDANAYMNNIHNHYFDNEMVIRCTEIALDNTPTIIEADKAESEE